MSDEKEITWLSADEVELRIGSPVTINGDPDSTGYILSRTELGLPRVRLESGQYNGKTLTYRDADLISRTN